MATPQRAFLDANVIRGQLTNDVLLSVAYQGAFRPQWSQDVLAAAVHGRANVLVTENTKDFQPPTIGPHAMQVERTSQFLNRLLNEQPEQVMPALQAMVERNQREPRTMPELIDKMVNQQDLASFARKLNTVVPPEQCGTDPRLAAGPERTIIFHRHGRCRARPWSGPSSVDLA